MLEKFDLIIIGGGTAAFGAAIRANALKAKTLMINAGLPLGGTCVNVGCVPSKMLLYAGEVLHLAKNHGISGIKFELKRFDFPKIIEEELALVRKLRRKKYEKVLKSLERVHYVKGRARFVSKNEVEVTNKKFYGEKFILAPGSKANVPPIEGINEVGFITHVEALQLKQQPKELIIVGAGPLGLEFAQMYARFGTKVTILQRRSSIFPPAENELTHRLREVLAKEGVVIITDVAVRAARKEKGKKRLSYVSEGKEEEVSGDEILLAAGKKPNTQGLGLEKAGVEVNGRQAIVVNQFFQTSQPHIFAVGDGINLPLRLEPTAGHEGTLAAENALRGAAKSIDYNTVPYTIFTDPQLAGVGFTEERWAKVGPCACRTVSFDTVAKAVLQQRTEGLIKMVIHPQRNSMNGIKAGQILGVHILAPNAGELIAEAMMLVKNKSTIDDIVESLPIFPTLSEAIKIAALSFTKDISKISCCI